MGRPIAMNLARAHGRVQAWNRSPRTSPGGGVRLLRDPAALSARTVLSVLPDVDQLREHAPDAVLGAWRRNGVRLVVVMSTTSRANVEALSGDLARHGIEVADAPMSGGVEGAASGRLAVMVGGSAAAAAEVAELFVPTGALVEHMGPTGSGVSAKLCNQMVVAGTLCALAEALATARREGLDGGRLLDVLSFGLAGGRIVETRGPRMLSRDFSGGGSAANQLKDLRYALEMVRGAAPARSPLAVAARLFEDVVVRGEGSSDHSVVVEEFG
jgi:2-hydroxy-3-oxopropionate reductase